MINSEMLSSLGPILLISGVLLNLLALAKLGSRSPSFQAISLSITVPIITLITPHYYHSFNLDLAHFLEHTVLKMLFLLAAINIQLFFATNIRSRQKIDVLLERVNVTPYVSEIDDNLEQIYETVELDLFNRGLYRLSTRATHLIEKLASLSSVDLYTVFEHMPHYVENILYPIEQNVNWLWMVLVKKGEKMPHVLSRIQTGLLSNNLLLILGFLLIFILLLFITPG